MIGVFDSGLGGLSVLAAIARTLPRADLLYLADTAHVPYGPRSDAYIRGRVMAIGQHLVDQGCQSVVVACNTATAAAVQALREAHPGIPIVGVEPGVKPAAKASRSGRIAVLATESTARSQRLRELIEHHAQKVAVQVVACPGWATRVETLHLAAPGFSAEVAARVEPLLDWGADQIVLGCTHYGFLREELLPLTRDRAVLVDVADAVARQTRRLNLQETHGDEPGPSGRLRLLATAQPERLQAALAHLGLQWLAQRTAEAARLAQV